MEKPYTTLLKIVMAYPEAWKEHVDILALIEASNKENL